MLFAMYSRHAQMPQLAPLPGLEVQHVWDANFMSRLQNRVLETVEARFADGHRPYVAWWHEEPAAWAWVATRTAIIGEASTILSLPPREAYLWDCGTVPAHRGHGIYPRLLQAIVRAEAQTADRYWIAYMPENRSLASGVLTAGFSTRAELAFDMNGRPTLRAIALDGPSPVSRLRGIRETKIGCIA